MQMVQLSDWWTETDLLPDYAYDNHLAMTPLRLTFVLASIACFELLNQFLKRHPSISKKNATLVVCLVHALIGSLFPLWIIASGHYPLHSFWGTPTSYCEPVPYVEYLVAISWGYFAWDLFKCLSDGWGVAFGIHASICSFLYFQPLRGPLLHRSAMQFLLYELSTVFLNIFQLAESYGYKVVGFVSKVLFAVTFLTVRMIAGFMLSKEFWDVFVFGNPHRVDIDCFPKWVWIPTVAMNGAFYLLNSYWFWRILEAAFGGRVKKDK